MTPYLQGWSAALVKLGLSPSATGAVKGIASPGVATPAATAAKKPIQPWSMQNKMEPKMHENAWNSAQKSLDVGTSRETAKVDQWQKPSPLPVGSA